MSPPSPSSPAAPGRRVVVPARGHPDVRATHAKTLEVTTEPDITSRATCVVGIAPPGALDGLRGLRGPVTVTLRAAGHSERITAVANPAFSDATRAVVRRSGRRSPETLAVEADRAAADLDRDLARALADPDVEIEVVVETAPASPQATAALVLVPRAPGVAGEPPVPTAAGAGEAAERLERGEAVALACDLDRPGEKVTALVGEAAGAGVPVRAAPGVEESTAALVAAGLLGVPHAVLGAPPSTSVARGRQLRALGALGVAGVWRGRVPRLAPLLADLAAWRPGAPAAVLLDPGGFEEALLAAAAGELAGQAGGTPARLRAVAVADLREPAGPDAAGGIAEGAAAAGVDGAVRDVLAALLAEGVTPRTLARALQRLPGVSGREGYEVVLALQRERGRQRG